MANNIKPGQTPGKNGGIFEETGPRGGKTGNFATIPDHHVAPPTSKPNRTWSQVSRTPDSKKR